TTRIRNVHSSPTRRSSDLVGERFASARFLSRRHVGTGVCRSTDRARRSQVEAPVSTLPLEADVRVDVTSIEKNLAELWRSSKEEIGRAHVRTPVTVRSRMP